MKLHEVLQVAAFVAAIVAMTPVLGRLMFRVFRGERTFLTPVLGWLELLLLRLAGVDPRTEMNWKAYAGSLLVLNIAGIALLVLIQMGQGLLPLNTEAFPGIPFALAFNTAVSFVTNTNWQAYSGEATMSYFTQMAGLLHRLRNSQRLRAFRLFTTKSRLIFSASNQNPGAPCRIRRLRARIRLSR